MNPAIEQHLLAHLLQADPAAGPETDRLVGCNPRTRRTLETLRAALAPLAADREPDAPPPDLWVRTVGRVAEHLVATEGPPSQAAPAPPACRAPAFAVPPPKAPAPEPVLMPASDPELTPPNRRNVLVAVGLSLAGLALVFPAVVHVRAAQARVACQESMMRFYGAAETYADRNAGQLPRIEDGEQVARVIAMLEESGSVGPAARFACPAAPAPGGSAFANYSYTLGYRDGANELRGLTTADDGAMPLLADAPLRTGDTHASVNHRRGQNVLFLGGHVRFCTHVTVGIDDDDIFVNDRGQVGAGLRHADSVLGRADERP